MNDIAEDMERLQRNPEILEQNQHQNVSNENSLHVNEGSTG